MAENEDGKTVHLTVPGEDPSNVQATKYFIFNETGNIMMASTDDSSSALEQSVRDVFNEVSVFFAAMTKAISTTPNPETGEPYSIYNYTALERILSGSGLFVHVTMTDITHTTSSVGLAFSRDLIAGLLGLATGSGALSFAQGMLASIGQEGLRITNHKSKDSTKVGNIVFVCEYLLGMPIVSAIVVYTDVEGQEENFRFGPCVQYDESEFTWQMHKDTYLFVTPRFVRDYSEDLLSISSNTSFIELVEYLRAVLTDRPAISEIVGPDGEPAPSALIPGTTYTITGVHLAEAVSMKLGADEPLEIGTANYSSVRFMVKETAPRTPTSTIYLYNQATEVIVSVPGYGIGEKPAPAAVAAGAAAGGASGAGAPDSSTGAEPS